jgi:hypothetical protein
MRKAVVRGLDLLEKSEAPVIPILIRAGGGEQNVTQRLGIGLKRHSKQNLMLG